MTVEPQREPLPAPGEAPPAPETSAKIPDHKERELAISERKARALELIAEGDRFMSRLMTS